MPPTTSSASTLSFEIKSAQLPLVALLLRSTDTQHIQHDLLQRFGDIPDFFDQDPLLIDLGGIDDQAGTPVFADLLPLLHERRLRPLAFRGGNAAQRQAAVACGLVAAEDATIVRAQQLDKERQGAATQTPTIAHNQVTVNPTALVLDKPLRSGQQVYARGRDVVVLAMVNPGAEVIADGHIHVYAPLRGRVIAGARGNTEARIFARSLEAELVSIAGVYRTSDTPLPENVRAKAAQVRLQRSDEGEKLLFEPII